MTDINYALIERDYDGGNRFGVARKSDGRIYSHSNYRAETEELVRQLNEGTAPTISAYNWYEHNVGWDVDWPVFDFEAAAADADVDWKARYEAMAARIGREANERSWCGEYDAIAAEEGWPARPARILSSYVTIGFGLPVKYEETSTPADAFNALRAGERRDLFRAHVRESAVSAAQWHGQPEIHPDVLDRLVTLLAQRTVPYVHTEA